MRPQPGLGARQQTRVAEVRQRRQPPAVRAARRSRQRLLPQPHHASAPGLQVTAQPQRGHAAQLAQAVQQRRQRVVIWGGCCGLGQHQAAQALRGGAAGRGVRRACVKGRGIPALGRAVPYTARTFCLRVSTALLLLAQKVTVRSVMQSVR
jgi:hypothetical protein